jgi:outer membrane receptor protein involved in Fe transport
MAIRVFSSLSLAALTTLSMSLAAQSTGVTTADLRGQVRAPGGAPVPKAVVRLTQDATNQVRVLTTDAGGGYAFRLLPPGSYTLSVEAPSFQAKRIKDIVLRIANTTELNVDLSPVEAQATVEVVGEATLVDPTRTQVSTVIDNNLINNLPINRRRFEDFSLTTPGVTTANSPDNGGAAANSGLVFAGVNPRLNNVMVDGLDNNDVSTGSVRTTFSQDAVQEFQVVTNGFSAEYGRAAGGTVNVVTKSGGNQFGGTLFYFRRDGKIDAKRPLSQSESQLKQNQFGATVGGAIVKDKLFYFASVERFEKNDANNVTIDSATANTIFQRTGFRVSQGLVPFVENVTTGIVKLDWAQSDTSRWSYRFTWAKEYNENQLEWGGLTDRSAGGARRIEDKSGSLSHLWNASARFVNDFRLLYSIRDHELLSLDSTKGPYIEILGAATFGTQRFLPQVRTEKSYQLSDTGSIFFDKVTLKLGVDLMRTNIQGSLPLNFSGIYRFQAIPGFPNGIAALNAANPYGGFGMPAAFVQGFGDDYLDFDVNYYSAFAQADWQVTPKFTLKLGLRYDKEDLPPFKDTADYDFLDNPTGPFGADALNSGSIGSVTGATGATATGRGPYDFASLRRHSNDWSSSKISPRVSFTWQATPVTRVYGGYGVFVGRTQLGPYGAVYLSNGTDLQTIGRRAPNTFASWASADGGANRRYKTFASALGPFVPGNPATARGGKVLLLPGDYEAPETKQANLGLEWSPRPSLKFTLDAVHSKGEHFMNVRDINSTIPNPGFVGDQNTVEAGTNTRLRNPIRFGPTGIPYSAIFRYDGTGESKYTSVTLGMAWQMRDVLALNASYAWSKAEDNYIDWLTQYAPQNTFDPDSEMGPSNHDQRHRVNLSAVLNTKGMGSAWTRNWVIALIGKYASGRPYSLWTGVDADYGTLASGPFAGTLLGNGEGLSAPADRPAGVKRNSETTPSITNVDLRISRAFKPGEKVGLEVILEVFNVFNHYNITRVQNFRTPPPGAPAFGSPIVTSSDNNRNIQAGVRFTF